MLSFAFNVGMSDKLYMDMDIYMHVLLESAAEEVVDMSYGLG